MSRSPADVIVCVHNSFDDVKACLDSALPTLSSGVRLIIVDDGSEKETQELCKSVASRNPEYVHLIRREEGSGFCKAANAGLRESDRDTVILLNSDTIVVGNWIDRLSSCLNANSRIGIAGPLSNAGGWQSIPNLPGPNASPNHVKSDLKTLRSINEFCRDTSSRFSYPVVEQVNGFCLSVKRSVIETIGLFNEERFPNGYGEENDFNLRAQEAGFLCAIAVDCFVYHSKTKSYSSDQRLRLTEAGQAQLRSLYGAQRIKYAVHGTQMHPVLVEIRKISMDVFAERNWTVASQDSLSS